MSQAQNNPTGWKQWTEEQDSVLRTMAEAGRSAREIGAVLGKSRNAIVGRCHRAKIKLAGTFSGAAAGRASGVSRKKTTVKAKPKVDAPLRAPTAKMLRLTQLTERTCKWPVGDPLKPGFGFCGVEVEDKPYCRFHRGLAYQPPAERKKRGYLPEPIQREIDRSVASAPFLASPAEEAA